MYTYGHTGKKGRAAVYARRSHWDTGMSLSVQTQIVNARRQAELMGYTMGDEDIFSDDGISGMTEDRPGFRAMTLKLFSPEKPYKAVFVTDISRLSRSSSSYFEYEDIFAEERIELISLMEPPGNPEVKIDTNRRMKAVMNEDQVVTAALKTRNSQMLAVETGFYIGWVAPFGYRKKKEMWKGEEHTKLEPDPETWHHLLHIIDMAKNNHTLTSIRLYLESTGLRQPAEGIVNKKRGGKRGTGRWTNHNISYLLKNLALLGLTFRGGEESGSRILHKTEQVVSWNAHEPAMTEEDRELILRNLAGRAAKVKSPRSITSPNPMSGLVVCGLCGATMRMHTEHGKQRLICANKRDHKKGEPEWCPNPMVKLDILVEKTTEAILGHILTPKVLSKQVGLVAAENRKLVAQQQSRKGPIEKRIKQLDKEIANIMAAIAEYGPTNPTYGREIDWRQEEKELLDRQLNQIDSELEDKLVFINDQERIVENALDLRTYLESEDPHDLTEMLNSLIRKVSIVNRVATLEYSVPLPRNQTTAPALMERLNLNKKTCPSIAGAGAHGGRKWTEKRSGTSRNTTGRTRSAGTAWRRTTDSTGGWTESRKGGGSATCGTPGRSTRSGWRERAPGGTWLRCSAPSRSTWSGAARHLLPGAGRSPGRLGGALRAAREPVVGAGTDGAGCEAPWGGARGVHAPAGDEGRNGGGDGALRRPGRTPIHPEAPAGG